MTGTYEHSIDAKGRLFIPAKLREELGVTFYLAMGVDACLAIYPQETWDRFTEKFASLPMSQSRPPCAPCLPTPRSASWTARAASSSPRSCANTRAWRRTPSSSASTTGPRSGALRLWNAQEEEEMTPEKMKACLAALGF